MHAANPLFCRSTTEGHHLLSPGKKEHVHNVSMKIINFVLKPNQFKDMLAETRPSFFVDSVFRQGVDSKNTAL